jgi:hypothetical protein
MEPRRPGDNDSVPQPWFRRESKGDRPNRKPVIFRGVGIDARLRADEGNASGLPSPHRNEWSSQETGETRPQPEPPDAPDSGEVT